MVSHLDPDSLVCEVKRALGSTAVNKASEGDGISAELFKILKDDAVKVLHPICQQIWKAQQWPQDWKWSVFTPGLEKFRINPRTGKVQCSSQSQRRAMPKNIETILKLCSFHTTTKLYSKSFKLGFSCT